MKFCLRLPFAATLSALLVACGGGGSPAAPSGAAPVEPATPVNVALTASGASVSATYGGTTANFVQDGDSTTTTNFWTGNVADDAVTVDFGQLRLVSEVTVYTNDVTYSSSSPKKYIEVSVDGSTWKTTMQPTSVDSTGNVGCVTYETGSGKLRCVFTAAKSLRYFRVRVTAVAPSAQNVVEMEALGT